MTTFLALLFVLLAAAAPVRAQSPDAQKIDVETRVMLWGDAIDGTPAPAFGSDPDVLVRRARVVIQGRASRVLTVYVQAGVDNVGARVLERGSFAIKDAYLNYRAAEALQIVAGQFKIPFLRANLESGFNQVLVDRGTLPTLRPAREGSRDRGVMAWGNRRALQYRFAMFAGGSPRISSRVAYNWFTKETGLGYTGIYLGDKRVLQVAAQTDMQRGRLDPRDGAFSAVARDYRASAIETFYQQTWHRWIVTGDAAMLRRTDDYRHVAAPTRMLNGYYAQGAVVVPGAVGPGRVQLAVRRETWDTRRDRVTTSTRTTIGTSYYLKDHNRKVQLDYTFKNEPAGACNRDVRLSLVAVF